MRKIEIANLRVTDGARGPECQAWLDDEWIGVSILGEDIPLNELSPGARTRGTNSMSRALTAAMIRIDALIARIHAECAAEASAVAFAPHHLGCTLHESHGGDCVINRPRRPRYLIAQGGR